MNAFIVNRQAMNVMTILTVASLPIAYYVIVLDIINVSSITIYNASVGLWIKV